MSQNKPLFITYIDKVEKSYLKAVKTADWSTSRYHFERGFPEKKDIFKVLRNIIKKPSFVLSNDLLNNAKKVADLINLRTKYPDHYIYEILFILDDLLAFIVHGYYTTNSQSYSTKLFEFFDLVMTFNDAITPYIKNDFYDNKFSYLIENKTQWFETTRNTFRELFKLVSFDNYQSFQSDSYYGRDRRFTIKIVKDILQIIYKKNYKPNSKFEDYYESYKIIDEFNKKNYKFKLNFKKIFKENVVQKEWYTHYLSKFYYLFESVDFPDSIDAMGEKKSLDQLNAFLDQLFSKNSNDKKLLKEEIFKKIDENSGVDYILDKGYLKHLTNKELLQLLTPFIRLLKTYSTEFHNSGNRKYHSLRDRLLKGYFALWSRREKILEKHGLHFDGYYHNFYYADRKKKVKIHFGLKLYDDGAIKSLRWERKEHERFENNFNAQGRYIYSSNKIYFFLSSQKDGSPYFNIGICKGILNKDTFDISTLYGSLTSISLSKGKYKFKFQS